MIGGLPLKAFTGADVAASWLVELLVAFAGALLLLLITRIFTRGGRFR